MPKTTPLANRHNWRIDFPFNQCRNCGIYSFDTWGNIGGLGRKGKKITLYSFDNTLNEDKWKKVTQACDKRLITLTR